MTRIRSKPTSLPRHPFIAGEPVETFRDGLSRTLLYPRDTAPGPVVGTFAPMMTNGPEQSSTGRGECIVRVDLYWLPLGAGGHSVRLNGRVFEAVMSHLEHRPACDLYHSALEVRVHEGRFVIEQAPVPGGDGARRGVAAGGAVGARWAGRFRIFRYEVRRWRDGVIPDIGEAVDSPRRL